LIIVRPEDVFHKVQLLRLLTEIADTTALSRNLFFKGGTCASMLGYLDRFSVDLDFDLRRNVDEAILKKEFYKVFKRLDLKVSDESKKVLEFFLKYEAPHGKRNTIKLDALSTGFRSNVYKAFYLPEVDRFLSCQTIETMFAHKLVAAVDRFEKHFSIAGRDIYDIHYFYLHGYSYSRQLVEERTGMRLPDFLRKLIDFIEKQISQRVINEDLNTLLPLNRFQKIRKVLKTETLVFIKDDLARLGF